MNQPLSRRRFLGGLGGLGFAGLTLGSAPLLGACSSGGNTKKLSMSNWITYIDEDSVDLFARKSGYKLDYVEDYNDNAEFFAKIQPELSQGRGIGRDLITPTFWMVARLIALGWCQPLPVEKAPNAKNLVPEFAAPVYDHERRFSLPWQAGMAGIAYNRTATGRDLRTFDDLLDPAFKGKIGMLTEMRDTIGLALLSLGMDPAKATFDGANAAFEKIEKAKAAGQIRQFTGNDYQDDLVAGNFVACIGWSGDVVQLSQENPALRFVIPEEGGMSFSDEMVAPRGAVNLDGIAKWIDFVYDPVNAARITATVQYVSPVKGVAEELIKLGGDAAKLVESPLVFPDDATRRRLHTFATLSASEEQRFEERFAKITGS